MKKRILLINPARTDHFIVKRVHMGLTLLGGILSRAGYEVKVVDYTFLKWAVRNKSAIDLAGLVGTFNPDIVGISVFTYLFDESRSLIDKIASLTQAPIMLGGPHVTFFPDDFKGDRRISYIVRGEAENVILELAEHAKKEAHPVIVNSPVPAAEDIPGIDLEIAFGNEHLTEYQIQLSRGCPFSCSFCNISLLSGRRTRARDLNLCIEQIKEAKKSHPRIKTVVLTDDCPNFDKNRFKDFLRLFKLAKLDCVLSVDNMRADLLDEETIRLYKEAGGRNICLGVESGNSEVFQAVNKGQSLEKIIYAAGLVRKHNIELGLCFVIGLPGDNLERNRDSINLANRLKPDYIYWNMCVPWPGTKVYEWFQENGTIGDVRNFSTLIDSRINFRLPPAFSGDFSSTQRIRAWLRSNLETYSLPIFIWDINIIYLPWNMLKACFLAVRYNLVLSLFKYARGLILYRIGSMAKVVLRRSLKAAA